MWDTSGFIAYACTLILFLPTLLVGIFWSVEDANLGRIDDALEMTKSHCVVSSARYVRTKNSHYCDYALYCAAKQYVLEDYYNTTNMFVDNYGLETNATYRHGTNGGLADGVRVISESSGECPGRNAWGNNRLFLCYLPENPATEFASIALETFPSPSGKITVKQAQMDIDKEDARLIAYLGEHTGLSPLGISSIVLISSFCLSLFWMLFVVTANCIRNQRREAARLARNAQERAEREVAAEAEAAARAADRLEMLEARRIAGAADREEAAAHKKKKKKKKKHEARDQSEMALLCSHCGAKQRANIVVCRKCHRANVEQFQSTMVAEEEELDQECVICLDNFSPGDEVVFLRCLHPFHKDCIAGWFNDKKHALCPICKAAVDDK